MEPDKVEEIGWFKVDEVHKLNLFLPMRQRVDTGGFQQMYRIFKESPI